MLYLCNDIVQNSRKETKAFVEEFGRVLPEALRLFAADPVMKRIEIFLIDFFGRVVQKCFDPK